MKPLWIIVIAAILTAITIFILWMVMGKYLRQNKGKSPTDFIVTIKKQANEKSRTKRPSVSGRTDAQGYRNNGRKNFNNAADH